MKKLLLIPIIFGSLMSCETKEDVQTELKTLQIERDSFVATNTSLDASIAAKRARINTLIEQLHILDIYKSGKTPKFILKLELKQSHFSLDIGTHMKDSMNAIEFDIPVDEDFYKSVKVGTNIVDDFRAGSFIMNGSFGDWKMKVISKRIK